jgi:nucleotide-binding universal stress UspA family protein
VWRPDRTLLTRRTLTSPEPSPAFTDFWAGAATAMSPAGNVTTLPEKGVRPVFKIVVVGTDGSSTADKAVESAAGIARTLNAKLHVVTAYKGGSGISAATGAAAGAALVDTGAGHAVAEESAKGVLDRAVESYGSGLDVSTHVVHADPVDAILSTAAEVGADLIVVGSKGMHRRILGSVPNSVAHSAECSVFIAKTD